MVDDERGLVRALQRGLTAEGFAVDVASTASPGSSWRPSNEYDAIVLDVMLPRRNGYDVVTELRARDVWTPVLMLSAKDGEYDVADGLDVGRRRLPDQAVLVRRAGRAGCARCCAARRRCGRRC